jgi:TetR/AcrR family transcriptional regulator, regulator of autoinduction and epiphytic fitness
LFAAVSAHREAHLQLLMGTIDPGGPLLERIDQVVAQRRRIFEWIAAVRRGALLMEPFSGSVHDALDGFRTAKRLELTRVFATEIAGCPERERATLPAALGVAGSWSTWDALRIQQGLDVEAASAALTLTLRSLLGAR